MKEIKSILKLYHSFKAGGEKAAIAQVVRVEESSYRREGARMLVFESGIFEGGISGGCLEGDALKRSQLAILKQEPSIVTYDTSKDDENQIGVGLGCNGVIDVLISPLSEDSKSIRLLERCIAERKAHGLATIIAVNGQRTTIKQGNQFYIDFDEMKLEDCDDDRLSAFILDQIPAVLEKSKSRVVDFNLDGLTVKIFIEYLPPSIHLALFGDNYDVYPMLDLAAVLDWEVSLVGNLQKLKKEKLAAVDHLFLKEDEEKPEIDDRTAVILMAHDFKTDKNNLMWLVKTQSPYIASLGPKKRYEKMLNEFETEGFTLSESDRHRIYAPCGLEIGANTPEEIANSIFSEILSVFSGKQGGMLRAKQGPIHERH